jgi:hypothetical protein
MIAAQRGGYDREIDPWGSSKSPSSEVTVQAGTLGVPKAVSDPS